MRDFDKYWRSHGQFEDAITENRKIEALLKAVALKAFNYAKYLNQSKINELQVELKEYHIKDES